MLEGSEGTHSEDDADAPLEERKMRRKHRNRLSAAASRQRKKEWVETLQEQLRALTAENQLLRQQLAAPSSQAGAAAGLLAFGGGTPAAAHAISADRALGRCLRAHGISEVRPPACPTTHAKCMSSILFPISPAPPLSSGHPRPSPRRAPGQGRGAGGKGE
jgi:hypothetical protein